MNNLIKFPRRSSPQPTSMVDELTALEIEVARARLSQIRSEIRYVDTLWVSYRIRKAMFWAAVPWVLSVLLK